MTTRLEKNLDENQPREQAGFRSKYSTTDHTHAICPRRRVLGTTLQPQGKEPGQRDTTKNHGRLGGIPQTPGYLQTQPCHLPEETGVQLLCAASYGIWCRDLDTDQASAENLAAAQTKMERSIVLNIYTTKIDACVCVSVCLCVGVSVCLYEKFDQFLPVRSHFKI